MSTADLLQQAARLQADASTADHGAWGQLMGQAHRLREQARRQAPRPQIAAKPSPSAQADYQSRLQAIYQLGLSLRAAH